MLIIFDCDGVLVDSEKLAAEIFSDVLAEFGVDLDPVECFEQFHGHTLSACYQWLETHYFEQLPDAFNERLAAATEVGFAGRLRPVDGVERVLEELIKSNIRFCVASNGGHRKIRHSLSHTGLLPYFENQIFSAEDVNIGKPAPDLFLLAARNNDVRAEDVLVIEDSLAGTNAAIAAEMDVWIYREDASTLVAGRPHFSTMAAIKEELTKKFSC